MDYIEGLISVIVPAYNVKEYIEECVESICNQSYRNLEIIIIDDGSTDGTGEICDSFIDERIRVIHQKNRGLSGARNAGIDIAKGEFIAFIDSDDYIKTDMFESLIKPMDNLDIGFTACSVEFLRCDDATSYNIGDSGEVIELDYGQSLDYLCGKYLFNVWNKLYRHKLVEDLRYELGVVCEDIGYIAKVFKRVKSTAYIDKPLYVYRVKRLGSSGICFDERKIPAIDDYERFIDYLSQNNFKDKCRQVRHHQLALIKSLYNETLDDDYNNRHRMHMMFCKKFMKNGAYMVDLKSSIAFFFFPLLSRSRYRKSNKNII